MKKARKPPDFTPEFVATVNEAVYRERLGGEAEAAAMIAEDKDDGTKLRGRAKAYEGLTRAYLKVLKDKMPA
jgi:hypothetical protein